MKQFDFLDAMNGLPEEYLSELTEWQQNRTPLPEAQEVQQAEQPSVQEEMITVKKQKNKEISVRLLRPVTAGIFGTIAACLVFGLYFGIRAHTGANNQPQNTPAAEIEEQSSAVQTAEAFPLPASAVYNPDRDEYYDSSVMLWDSGAQVYRFQPSVDSEKDEFLKNANPDDYVVWDNELNMYVMTGKEMPTGIYRGLFFPLIPYDSSVPAAFADACGAYDEANALYAAKERENDPYYMIRSHIPTDPEAPGNLVNESLPYRMTCCEMAVTDGEYRDYAQTVVRKILGVYCSSEKGAYFQYQMYRLLTEATDKVKALGDSITAEDCAQLQTKYGCLIAPALKEAGKLDLLHIDPEQGCTDPEQLAETAAWFAVGHFPRTAHVVTTTKPSAADTQPVTTETTAASTASVPQTYVTVPQNYPDASLSFGTAVLAAENRWVPCREEWVEHAAETEAEWRGLIDGFAPEEVENYREVLDFTGGGFMLRITDGSTAVTYELFSQGLYKRITEDEAGTHTAYYRDSSGNETELVWAIQKQLTAHNYQWSNFANAFTVTE